MSFSEFQLTLTLFLFSHLSLAQIVEVPDTTHILKLIDRGNEYYGVKQLDSANKIAIEIVNLSKKVKFRKGLAEGFFLLGKIEYYRINRKKATNYLNTSLSDFIALHDYKRIADIYNLKGLIYKNEGKYNKSLILFNSALNIYEKEELDLKIAQVLSNLGVVQRNLGNFEKSIEYYHRCNQIYILHENIGGIARTYGNLSNIYMDLEEYDLALDNVELAYQYFRKIDNKSYMAICLGNAGIGYLKKLNYAKALESTTRAIELNIESDNQEFLADNYKTMGDIYLSLDSIQMAIEYFDYAEGIIDEFSIEGVAKSELSYSLGMMYLELNNLPKAQIYIMSGLREAISMEDNFMILKGYKNLHSYYRNINSDSSLKYLEAYLVMKDKNNAFNTALNLANKKMEIEIERIEFDLTQANSRVEYLSEFKKGELIRIYIFSGLIIISIALLILLLIKYTKLKRRLHEMVILKERMRKSRPYFENDKLIHTNTFN